MHSNNTVSFTYTAGMREAVRIISFDASIFAEVLWVRWLLGEV